MIKKICTLFILSTFLTPIASSQNIIENNSNGFVICGDVNDDNVVNIADLTSLVSYLFNSGNPPQPNLCIGDVNGDSSVNIADLTSLVGYLFAGGAAPVGNCCPVSGVTYGSFYINDCGQPHGGFEYCGTYYANMTLNQSNGFLNIELKIGLGDPLQQHIYNVELIEYTYDTMRLSVENQNVTLIRIENDTIWNKWHNYFIASHTDDVPERRGIGIITPDIFPDLPSHYYVELRFPDIQQTE